MSELKQSRMLMLACLILSAAVVGQAADPAWYAKKDTWQETAFAACGALATHLAAQAEKEGLASQGAFKLGPWWMSETLAAPKGLDTVSPPEQGLIPTSQDAAAKKMWRRQNKWRDSSIINLKGSNCNVYVFRTIEAEAAVNAPAWLGCDDRMMVWLNGKPIFSNPTNRGVAPNQDKIMLPLQAGENALLMKIYNAGGAYAFYFSTQPGPSKAGASETDQLWNLLGRDFADEEAARQMQWERTDKIWEINWNEKAVAQLADRYYGRASGALRNEAGELVKQAQTPAQLQPLRKLYYRGKLAADTWEGLKAVDLKSLRLAIEDLKQTFPERYDRNGDYLRRLGEFEKQLPKLQEALNAGKLEAVDEAAAAIAFQREALLANPLLDFDKIAVVRRRFGGGARNVNGSGIGAPSLNSHTNDTIKHTGWDNEVAVLSNLRGAARLTTLFKPEGSPILRDMDVDFDAGRIMFSSIGANDRWALFEINRDGSGLRQITPTDLPDVDFFDSCYLPNGRIVGCSTAGYQGLPCEGGGRPMVNLYLIDPKTKAISQLTFEQDSDYHPCVLNNGRVLYTRWEYSDIQHYFSRILFSCNPDGTNQAEYYGSGSYFPTAYKHARACPDHPTKVVGIIGGHHATSESGRMAIVDPALARKYPLRHRPKTKEWGEPGSTINLFPAVLPASQTGFVQEIPGYGKDVVGNVYDGQGTNVYPNFVYPYPLSEKYILVSMKRTPNSLWGLYLVDVFDNMTLLKEEEGAGLFDAFPFAPRPRPPVIPDRVVPGAKMANVFITDVYRGPGLAGIPRGAVKRLRLFAYHFAYNKTGGHASVGVESSWDIKRILGTVPIEADGSAHFTIPANTPISIQPLDAEGASLQLMRSWLVGKPGEIVSCGGCHEKQNQASVNSATIASRRPPTAIEPWYGEARPFSYKIEVQPVMEKYCAGCHDGNTETNGRKLLSFKDENVGYKNLHPYVRRPGPESDMAMLRPLEYHASTSPLIQMLKKGHHNVKLDREAWERLYCWIDLNAPQRGSWSPPDWRGKNQSERRLELAKLYAGVEDNPEETYSAIEKAFATRERPTFIKPAPLPVIQPVSLSASGFPFSAAQARQLQTRGADVSERELDLGSGQKIKLVRIPAGQFIMGAQNGYPDESPRAAVRIDRPFWIGATEITNAQYAAFDPLHDTRYYDEHGKDQAVPGYIGNHDDQPVARISWREAVAFCQWLGVKTGAKTALPTEAQWEWAARAGSAGEFYYGDLDANFSEYANLSDHTRLFTQTGWDGGSKIHKLRSYDPKHHFPLRDDRGDDKSMVTNYVGQYQPNAWGLRDTVGNVAEWTQSSYRPYPYNAADGRDNGNPDELKVARGGSWHDRPKTATASVRQAYQPYQKVFNVGFRIVLADDEGTRKIAGAPAK